MMASRIFVHCAATCLLVASLLSQNLPSGTIQKLLPPDAKVIETANLNAVAGKPRELVLWMRSPEKEVRKPDGEYCGDAVYGDNWVGPTRLSLVDSANEKLLNTVTIVGPAFLRDPADSFRLPFFVPNYYYTVQNVDSKREGVEGVPRILDLRDFTGDGVAAEFALFKYEACGLASTSVLGYNPQSDRAVKYAIEVSNGMQKPKAEFWVGEVFGQKPVRPGYWRFTWKPGHGFEGTIQDEVTFDKARQLFVDKRTYPGAVLRK